MLKHALIETAPAGWDQMEVAVLAAGSHILTASAAAIGRKLHGFEPEEVVIEALRRLRKVMYREDVGTWYEAVVEFDWETGLHVTFGYDDKPVLAGQISAELWTQILLEDHAKYPRDQKHLPGWHPAKIPDSAPLARYRLPEYPGRWLEPDVARRLHEDGRVLDVVDSAVPPAWQMQVGPGAYRIEFLDPLGTILKVVTYVPREGRLWRALVIEHTYADLTIRRNTDEAIASTVADADPATDFVRIVEASAEWDGRAQDLSGLNEDLFWQPVPLFGFWSTLLDAARKAGPRDGITDPARVVEYVATAKGESIGPTEAWALYFEGSGLTVRRLGADPRWVMVWEEDGVTVSFHDEHDTLWRQVTYWLTDGRLWRGVCIDYVYPDDQRPWSLTEAVAEVQVDFGPDGAVVGVFRQTGTAPYAVEDSGGPTDAHWYDKPVFGRWFTLTDPGGPRLTRASFEAARAEARRGKAS